jgi:molybdopterin-guanine dinucleotide biosynthesis protein
MKIIAVVGTGSGCGKTTVACRILQAIPGLGAVKISPHHGESRVEWGAGEPGKDTDLYVGSGAIKVARIIGPRNAVSSTWELIESKFEGCLGVVIEGACALDIPRERLVVFVVGATVEKEREDRNRAIAAVSTIIFEMSSHLTTELPLDKVHTFLAGPSHENT